MRQTNMVTKMNDVHNDGFLYDDEPVHGFAARCEKCGSASVTLDYEFNYYGGMTGYDQTLSLECRNCGNRHEFAV